MDVSSEMIDSLLPVFMVTTLRVRMLRVVVIEGAAEAMALMLKVFAGVPRVLPGGLPLAWAPLALVLMNVVFALSTCPLGKLSGSTRHTAYWPGGWWCWSSPTRCWP